MKSLCRAPCRREGGKIRAPAGFPLSYPGKKPLLQRVGAGCARSRQGGGWVLPVPVCGEKIRGESVFKLGM